MPSFWYDICDPKTFPLKGYRIVGRCDLRLGYNKLIYYGGNIGYRVHPPFRGHHMAAKATRVLLDYAAGLGMPYVIITCNPDNFPSRKTLTRLCGERGGWLLDVVDLPGDNVMYQRGERQKCVFFFPFREGVQPPTPETIGNWEIGGAWEALARSLGG